MYRSEQAPVRLVRIDSLAPKEITVNIPVKLSCRVGENYAPYFLTDARAIIPITFQFVATKDAWLLKILFNPTQAKFSLSYSFDSEEVFGNYVQLFKDLEFEEPNISELIAQYFCDQPSITRVR